MGARDDAQLSSPVAVPDRVEEESAIHRHTVVMLTISVSRVAMADSRDAAVLHARALASEDDGDAATAIGLLREAHAIDPTSELVAYDLARLSLESATSADADLVPLVTLPLRYEASRRMKVYALLALGRADDAKVALHATRFDAQEADALRTLLEDVEPVAWALDASLGAERDSNITLLPDSEGSQDSGTRLVFDTALPYRPNERLELGFIGQLGHHLDDRDVLADYDYAIASVVVSLGGAIGPVELNADVTGTVVTSSLMAEVFSDDANVRVDAQLERLPLHPGLYVRAAGLLLEEAQGTEQRQRGIEDSLFVRYNKHNLTASSGVSATRRFYVDATTARRDTRVSPSLDATYDFTRTIGLGGGSTYTFNGSNADTFRYDRHIFRLTRIERRSLPGAALEEVRERIATVERRDRLDAQHLRDSVRHQREGRGLHLALRETLRARRDNPLDIDPGQVRRLLEGLRDLRERRRDRR